MAKKASTTKKSASVKSTKEIQGSSVLTLGDKQSDVQLEMAASDESLYRIKYKEPQNVFAIVHPSFLAVKEHWIRIGDDTHRIVCGVHRLGGLSDVVSKRGYAEGCKYCALCKTLYEEAPRESKDPVDIRKRKFAYEISAKVAYYMYVIKGDCEVRRKNGKKIIIPYFENDVIRKLVMTKDAFKKFHDAFNDQNFVTEDAPGLPVNFVGGENEGGFASIQSVEFFPEEKIEIDASVVPNTFGDLDQYNEEKADEVYEDLVNIAMPEYLAGLSERKEKKSSTRGKSKETGSGKKKASAKKKTARRK